MPSPSQDKLEVLYQASKKKKEGKRKHKYEEFDQMTFFKIISLVGRDCRRTYGRDFQNSFGGLFTMKLFTKETVATGDVTVTTGL